MSEGKLRAEGDRAGVRFERRYDFSPEEVWSALTEPERLGRWLANVAELELRVGGRFLLVWKEDDGDQRTDGRVRELDPGRVLELDWTYPGEADSVARFELRPDGDGTILVLDHRGLPPVRSRGTAPVGTRISTRSRRTSRAASPTGLRGSRSSGRPTSAKRRPSAARERTGSPVEAVDLRLVVLGEP